MQFRCVKCTQTHQPGCCSISENDGKEALSCVLCGQAGHPASYRNCPVYKRKIREREEIRNKAKTDIIQRQKMFNNFVNPSQNYSSILKGNSSRENKSYMSSPNTDSSSTNQLLLELNMSIREMNQRVEQNSSCIQQIFEILSKNKH
jgi:hypothetical protein